MGRRAMPTIQGVITGLCLASAWEAVTGDWPWVVPNLLLAAAAFTAWFRGRRSKRDRDVHA